MRFPLDRIPLFSRWRLALAALAVLIVGVYVYAGRGANLGAVLVVSPGDFVQQVHVSGTVTASQDVDLGFAASGRVSGVYAKVGDRVESGTILTETENGDLVATVAQKQAALAQAQANLAALKAGTRSEEVAIAAVAVTNAQGALVNAIQNAYTTSDDAVHNRVDSFFINPRTTPKLSFNLANASLQMKIENSRANIETVLKEWAALVGNLSNENATASAKQVQVYLAQVVTLLSDANGALNQSLPDQLTSSATLASYATSIATARMNVNTAASTLSVEIADLDAAESTLALKRAGSTGEAIAAQEAAVSVAAADVRSAQAKLAATRIMAPFSGIVTRMDAEIGEIISPTTPQISMQSNGVFEIETYVPEVSVAGVEVGDMATTTLDAYGSSVEFAAKVIKVDPAETVKDGVPTYKTKLVFLVPDPRVRSGMTANVLIVTGVLRDAIVIPAGAVGTKDGSSYVSLVVAGSATRREVAIGVSPSLGQVEILSGLAKGDTILLTPVP